jgi:probable rRNA maturation factor
MVRHKINVQIKRGLGFAFSSGWIRATIAAVLGAESICEPFEIDCVITDEATIQALNKTYRRKDSPTDVLSFSLIDHTINGNSIVFPAVPDTTSHLGEIVISYPQAMKQAENLGHDVKQEMRLLLVHGTLHLLGYDHISAGDARKMKARETKAIKRIDEDLKSK